MTYDKRVDKNTIPNHLAIICDGNGRWAKKRGLPRTVGHGVGVETVKNITIECNKAGVKHLSLYGFSTENWKRPQSEVEYLMKLFIKFFRQWRQEASENNIRFNHIGELNGLPEKLIEEINQTTLKTMNNDGMICNIAINYGSRSEIIRAIKKISSDYKEDHTILDNLNVENFNNYLDTNGQPEIDLLIRTGGEYRISNFLLWQVSNAYFWVDSTLWPDFKSEKLSQAFNDYKNYINP